MLGKAEMKGLILAVTRRMFAFRFFDDSWRLVPTPHLIEDWRPDHVVWGRCGYRFASVIHVVDGASHQSSTMWSDGRELGGKQVNLSIGRCLLRHPPQVFPLKLSHRQNRLVPETYRCGSVVNSAHTLREIGSRSRKSSVDRLCKSAFGLSCLTGFKLSCMNACMFAAKRNITYQIRD